MLTAHELSRMDAALISHVRPQSRKLALIVALAMTDCEAHITNVADAFFYACGTAGIRGEAIGISRPSQDAVL